MWLSDCKLYSRIFQFNNVRLEVEAESSPSWARLIFQFNNVRLEAELSSMKSVKITISIQ